jgi:glycosyltransferase involved in cell wall biosynthesis/uncharacterized protein YoxC
VFVTYEELLSDWNGLISRVQEAFRLEWPVAFRKAEPQIKAFLDDTLRHNRITDTVLIEDKSLSRWIRNAYFAIVDTIGKGDSRLIKTIDTIEAELKDAGSLYEPVLTDVWGKYRANNALLQKQNKKIDDISSRLEGFIQDKGYYLASIDHLQADVKARDERIQALDAEATHLQTGIKEKDERIHVLDAEIKKLGDIVDALKTQSEAILKSTSWKLTAPLRASRRLFNVLYLMIRRFASNSTRAIWRSLPINMKTKLVVKKIVFKAFPFLFKHTVAYRAWQAHSHHHEINLDFTSTNHQGRDPHPLFVNKPLISVLMPTYNIEARFLKRAIDSVVHQVYSNWELCICDDGSTNPETVNSLLNYAEMNRKIHINFLPQNQGISAATNAALNMASGEYVAMLDNDDELTPDALLEIVKVLNEHPKTDVIYTDQDIIDANGLVTDMYLKPDWSLELFRGVMYVGHLLVVKSSLAKEIGGFDPEFDKVQDFEFMLRISERTKRIFHIPKILYHWRKIPGSVAYGGNEKSDIEELQAKAVNAHLERSKITATAYSNPNFPHRVLLEPHQRKSWPKISMIIQAKGCSQQLLHCLKSIIKRTMYKDFEIIVALSGLVKDNSLEKLKAFPIEIIKSDQMSSNYFSTVNHAGLVQAKGQYLVFLNSRLEIITEEWLEKMLFYLELPDVGCVGPLLLKPNDTVQSSGIIIRTDGTVESSMYGQPAYTDGYLGSLSCAREVSAVSEDCLMISRELFEKIGGFQDFLSGSYCGVDLSLRLTISDLRVLFIPAAVLRFQNGGKKENFEDPLDRALFIDKWHNLIVKGDPFYNPNRNLN